MEHKPEELLLLMVWNVGKHVGEVAGGKPFDIEQLLQVLGDAFAERMRKTFEFDQERAQKLAKLATGTSPLGILRVMKEIDDEK